MSVTPWPIATWTTPLARRAGRRTDLDPTGYPTASHRRTPATGRRARRPGGDPRAAGPGLCRRVSTRRSRREQSRCRCSRPNCRAMPNVSIRRSRRAALRRAHHHGGPAQPWRPSWRRCPATAQAHVLVIDGFPTRRAAVRAGPPRHGRHLPPAVHLGLDTTAGRRGDHPPGGRHQPAADDPVDRPAGPKHPRRQLVTALP